jgi:hypothetical protein
MTFPQKVTWPKQFLLLFSVFLHKNEYIPGVGTHVLVPISTHPILHGSTELTLTLQET